MNDLSYGVASLESLGLAHDGLWCGQRIFRLTLTASSFQTLIAQPRSGRNSTPTRWKRVWEWRWRRRRHTRQGRPRMEQFALGSLYYLINCGFEACGDCCIGNGPCGKEPGAIDKYRSLEKHLSHTAIFITGQPFGAVQTGPPDVHAEPGRDAPARWFYPW